MFSLIGKNLSYFLVADSNKPRAVLTAVFAFLFFKNLEIGYSKVINIIAASTFGVLLIHANSDTMPRSVLTIAWLSVALLSRKVLFRVK